MTPHSVVDPATEDVVTEVESLDVAQVDAAVARAVAAGPAWRAVAPATRPGCCAGSPPRSTPTSTSSPTWRCAAPGTTSRNARWEAGNVRDVLDYYAAAPSGCSAARSRSPAAST